MAYLDDYLEKVLKSISKDHVKSKVDKANEKFEHLKQVLSKAYGTDLYSPFKSGSSAKHTVVNLKFDLDFVAPFKRSRFSTLKQMFEDVEQLLTKEQANDADLVQVRKQKTSFGLFYSIDGEDVEIDVVPGRELNEEDFSETDSEKKSLNLYWNGPEKEYIKTNIHKQVEHIKGRDRKTIKLLKNWKMAHNKAYKSFFIELLVIKAFDAVGEDMPSAQWNQLKRVLEYIRDNVTTVTLKDPGNSNNCVEDTLEDWQKQNLKAEMSRILQDIEYNEREIEHYFPVNADHDEETKKRGRYGLAGALGAGASNAAAEPHISTPRQNQRFG